MAKKKNDDASPSEKVIGLYGLLLFTGRKYTLSELANKFRCSKQTILRMIETIERSHTLCLVSEIENGRRVFWIDSPKRKLNISLQPQSVRYLNLCKDMVGSLLPEGIRNEIERTIEMSESLVTKQAVEHGCTHSPCAVTGKGTVNYDLYQSQIEILLEAIEHRLICRVAYQKADASHPQEYLFAPDRLHTRNSALYVEGWRVTNSDTPEIEYEQTFAVHRITKIETTESSFDFGMKQRSVPQYFGFGFSEPFQVKAKFEPSAASYVSERQWSSEQQIEKLTDGSILITFTAQSYLEVLSWILSFGSAAELLEPEELRQDLLDEAKQLLQTYA